MLTSTCTAIHYLVVNLQPSNTMITKNHVLLTLACLAALGSFAQTTGTLTLSLGPNFPAGAFASKNGNDPSSGLANIGAVAALSWWQPIRHTHFGVVGSARFSMNGMNSKATLKPFEESEPTYQWSMNKSHWSSGALLAGPYYQLPLARRFDLRINLQAGAALCYSPTQTVTGIRDSVGFGPVDVVQASVGKIHVLTFTALAGAGLSYHLTRHCSLLLHADYTYMDPAFRNLHEQVTTGQHLVNPGIVSTDIAEVVTESNFTRNYTQAMSSVNVTVGFGYSW
jgi:hypothetical protein